MKDFLGILTPEVGETIYVPTALYLNHGVDDFHGGKARVIEVKEGISGGEKIPFIRIAERPSTQYNWPYLKEKQTAFKAEFGDCQAYPDPDDHPDSNRWD